MEAVKKNKIICYKIFNSYKIIVLIKNRTSMNNYVFSQNFIALDIFRQFYVIDYQRDNWQYHNYNKALKNHHLILRTAKMKFFNKALLWTLSLCWCYNLSYNSRMFFFSYDFLKHVSHFKNLFLIVELSLKIVALDTFCISKICEVNQEQTKPCLSNGNYRYSCHTIAY